MHMMQRSITLDTQTDIVPQHIVPSQSKMYDKFTTIGEMRQARLEVDVLTGLQEISQHVLLSLIWIAVQKAPSLNDVTCDIIPI